MTFPFDDPDFVGPEDRPQYVSPLEITMYGWRGQSTTGVKDFLDSIAPGGVASSILMAPKTEQQVVVVLPVGPEVPKVHKLTLSPDHKTVSWSLYTALLKFNFPKVNANHKAVFTCRPGDYNGHQALLIDVAHYRVERIAKDEEIAVTEDMDE
ncbi:MAG TPA: hypothetical protein VD973_19525 [Symbiobacteriaceae bacterium]|jgi:hypothetical protein|nr:hypothetical protein [Symbiobacteriaceae bacterium]